VAEPEQVAQPTPELHAIHVSTCKNVVFGHWPTQILAAA
jgi:hypothetical protein